MMVKLLSYGNKVFEDKQEGENNVLHTIMNPIILFLKTLND